MAWDTVLTERLRYIINDFDATAYKYTDAQLKKFLVISASLVVTELPDWADTLGSYTIDTSAGTISPDPVETSPSGFSNLIVLKAACIIGRAELKLIGATGGWKIVDDRSTIDGTNAVKSAKDTADTLCGAYNDTLDDFKKGNSMAGEAIFGPYASSNGPWGQGYGWPNGRI